MTSQEGDGMIIMSNGLGGSVIRLDFAQWRYRGGGNLICARLADRCTRKAAEA